MAEVPARGPAALRRRDGLRARAGRSPECSHARVELGDTGYTPPEPGVREAFVGIRATPLGLDGRPGDGVLDGGDVMMGVVEILRAVTGPGDRVIVTPPVYPPFYDTVEEAGAVVERVPLAEIDAGWELDLLGIEAAFARQARAPCCCATRTTPPARCTRARVSRPSPRSPRDYGATVVSDEIHGPLAHGGVPFTPFLDASSDAARRSGTR